MFADTFTLERNPRLPFSLTMIMPDLPAPSWAFLPPHLFHPFSLSSQPSNNFPPAINSSTDPPTPHPFSLPPLITMALSPSALGPDEMKLFPTIIFLPLWLYSLLHSPLLPSCEPQQLMELFIKLVKSSSPWQIMTLLEVSILSKPNVCLHKKYSVHNLKAVKVSPGLQNTDLIWILPTHLSMLLW